MTDEDDAVDLDATTLREELRHAAERWRDRGHATVAESLEALAETDGDRELIAAVSTVTGLGVTFGFLTGDAEPDDPGSDREWDA